MKHTANNLISCDHDYENLGPSTHDQTGKTVITHRCKKCNCVILLDVTRDIRIEAFDLPLAETLKVKPELISRKSNISNRRIYIKRKLARTEYYAKKHALKIAMRVFYMYPHILNIRVTVAFEWGIVEADVPRDAFFRHWNLNVRYIRHYLYLEERFFQALITKEEMLACADIFCTVRFNAFVPTGSLISKLLMDFYEQRYYK